MKFLKGHGTENDFVILTDWPAHHPLTGEVIRRLCDRRAGIGGDGLIRVATAGELLDAGVLGALPAGVAREHWFMDYYNADGSTAEMCGNGMRVFAHTLLVLGKVNQDSFVVGSRAGAKPIVAHSFDDHHADISVEMGPATVLGVSTCTVGNKPFAGLGVDVGNPHLACVVPGLAKETLAVLDLQAPVFDTEFFPEGVNVEILTEITGDTVHMRVYERGVGETRSCGTGTVAAARAALADVGKNEGTVRVTVPGGTVTVTITGEDASVLRGPSAIVASGELYVS